MFKFEKEQKIYDIAGVKIGGQPGQLPTTMIGSIFYYQDKIIRNEKTGEFDKEAAEQLLNAEKELSTKTGNPRVVDVCSSNPETFAKFIDFIADRVDGPFCIDGTTADVRMVGARHVGEVGLSSRVIYNSMAPEIKEDEILAIKDAKIRSALILLLNTSNPLISGRMAVIDELLVKSQLAGVENVLVDTAVFDIYDPGPVAKAIYLVKQKYGYPSGCGAHNAIAIWNKRRKLSEETFLAGKVVANTLPVTMGANFLLYGPIKYAREIYTPIAIEDAFVAYTVWQEYGTNPLSDSHPFYNLQKLAK
jgi:tetrahydromethanopterin S-methyltransferase subunit H